jgi:glycosyltransferase 2 family protein
MSGSQNKRSQLRPASGQISRDASPLLKPGPLRTFLAFAGVALAAGCIAWLAFNVPNAVDALKGFDTRLLPVLLALVTADYAMRFYRWRWLLRRATGLHVPLLLDAHLFLAGTAMILTPGRAGEWLKCVYAERLLGVPVVKTAPIPLLERLVDVPAMLALAALGALFFETRLVLIAAPTVAAGLLLGGRTLLPLFREHFGTMLDSPLMRRDAVAWALAMGTGAWALECVAFYVVLTGFGVEGGIELLGQAAFIYPLATLLGTFSFLPGGIGIAEGGIAGALRATTGTTAAVATGSALVIRFAIVGLGVIAGLPSFLLLGGKTLKASKHEEDGPRVELPRAA